MEKTVDRDTETAIFAGCFCCLEPVFDGLDGVVSGPQPMNYMIYRSKIRSKSRLKEIWGE